MSDHQNKKPARHNEQHLHEDRWQQLRQFTAARIGLGRAGTSLATSELLKFQLAHAQAIDAVHAPLDSAGIKQSMQALTYHAKPLEIITLQSEAADRLTYLQRPDLGRKLREAGAYQLQQYRCDVPVDVAVVVADGLSATAVHQQAPRFLPALLKQLEQADRPWRIGPLCIVEQGRVAIGDDIAQQLNAQMVVVLIGERPGLSSPDSLGIYLTWAPRRGFDDAKRNCISNVRPAGLAPDKAAHRCAYLMASARDKQLSGVALKDRSDDAINDHLPVNRVFMLPVQRDDENSQ
ncbi:ethanolamine ammonia-lyase subunit EutC [Alteromonas gilva]|uniref:Ethanolamine ammonia-lyase small subunit n=1 Tax=Alteromonas gilva TaxID=2987522 RepID=A0ABT5L4I0_9ALTE|nr:ethanolamine ammonia-lyase subunit EutC [Alteromonas gilva]MDC8831950.1 ethanolamine ammonia-lyase subunit EutC [Alteromonas gilva]